MADDKKTKRLSKVAREFNVGISTIVEFLDKKGLNIDSNPNTKISGEFYELLVDEYSKEKSVKKESEKLSIRISQENTTSVSIDDYQKQKDREIEQLEDDLLIVDLGAKTEDIEKLQHPEEVVDKIPESQEVHKEPEPVVEKKPKKKKAEKTVEVPEPEPEKPLDQSPEKPKKADEKIKVVGEINLDEINQKTRPKRKTKEEKVAEKEKKEKGKKKQLKKAPVEKETPEKEEAPVKEEIQIVPEEKEVETPVSPDPEEIKTTVEKLSGPTVVGKIELPKKPVKKKPVASSSEKEEWKQWKKKKRKRIKKKKIDLSKDTGEPTSKGDVKDKKSVGKTGRGKRRVIKPEISEEEVQKQVKDTLARLTTKTKSKGAKHRKLKREAASQKEIEKLELEELKKKILKVTEFVSVNEIAQMMDVQVNEIISTCMNLGLFVSINQRLDAETMSIVADEFGYEVEFTSIEVHEAIKEEEDLEKDLITRPPIVTVMGHVDHGKTSLLDHIRKTNVIAGEAGGITQHIGAYNVSLDDGRKITFLDTPGHEAFTAMRARGAQATDIAIIVVAADDNVMPQTIEAINHASAAGVPIIFAINKMDKPGANPEKIKEKLANMNYLVEDWGGKYQSQEISAKKGDNIDELLDKVLLEAEMLDLKANPNKHAIGTVIESTLDKGRGYITTLLVKAGTLNVQDILLAGCFTGRVKAMFNERGKKIKKAGPSEPVLMLGLGGAALAGDYFNVMITEREAREIAAKREQLIREQGLRTQKHITLDEIGRRKAIGNFQELNIIVKGDVDGSIEALSDSLIKLSSEEIQLSVVHKAIGQITETDINLAIVSDAIIIGFQVRPSLNARKLAENEGVDIRLYSVIYDAINEIKDAMQGMLRPKVKEKIIANAEVLEVFKITRSGLIAGCQVKDGKILRASKVRLIRDGIVIYTGALGSLKRFKEDVKEVGAGYECGLSIENFNDIKAGDFIEAFEIVEV